MVEGSLALLFQLYKMKTPVYKMKTPDHITSKLTHISEKAKESGYTLKTELQPADNHRPTTLAFWYVCNATGRASEQYRAYKLSEVTFSKTLAEL